jgi:hypothetical protein
MIQYIQYFVSSKGIQVKLLDLHELPGENAETLSTAITSSLGNFVLSAENATTFCNMSNANYGVAERRAQRMYTNLTTCLGRNELIGIACSAHIFTNLHNAMQTGADWLPFNVEQIVCKIYQHFSIYTTRVEQLKDFCEFADVECKKHLRYTRKQDG